MIWYKQHRPWGVQHFIIVNPEAKQKAGKDSANNSEKRHQIGVEKTPPVVAEPSPNKSQKPHSTMRIVVVSAVYSAPKERGQLKQSSMPST